jgi:intracellular sulfur oxidation DsrE/DsrF family protein
VVLKDGEKALFNIDSKATTDGTSSGYPVALRHMWMLGTANLGLIKKLSLDKTTFHIRGVIHGSAITWALSDQWWIDNVPGATGNPAKEFLDKITGLQAKGLDITLEACGVTMYGKGLTHDDLYPGIQVDQGAIGRIIDLQQNGYTYIQEGFVDNDNAYLTKGANN